MIQSYDLAIVGGGIVGLTLAASLADSHLSIALIEGNTPNRLNDDVINRVSAISFASQTIFEKLGIWQLLDKKRITAYDTMKVWDQDSAAKIDFDAKPRCVRDSPSGTGSPESKDHYEFLFGYGQSCRG